MQMRLSIFVAPIALPAGGAIMTMIGSLTSQRRFTVTRKRRVCNRCKRIVGRSFAITCLTDETICEECWYEQHRGKEWVDHFYGRIPCEDCPVCRREGTKTHRSREMSIYDYV